MSHYDSFYETVSVEDIENKISSVQDRFNSVGLCIEEIDNVISCFNLPDYTLNILKDKMNHELIPRRDRIEEYLKKLIKMKENAISTGHKYMEIDLYE